MKHSKDFFQGYDSLKLFYQQWQPSASSKSDRKGSTAPVLVFIHGMAEHSDRYQFPIHYFTSRGFPVYAMDLRGHGESHGLRAYANHIDEFVEDIRLFIEKVRQKEKVDDHRKKIFLIGHSFGAQLSLNFGQKYPQLVSGIITSSANIRLRVPVPWIKKTAAPLLSKILPKLALSNEIDPALVCRNPETVAAYRQDKRILKKITTRLGNEVLSNLEIMDDVAKGWQVPCLLLHGGDDQICCPNGTKEFFKKIPIKDKSLIVYDKMYHEIFNESEKERERVFEDMEKWIEKRI